MENELHFPRRRFKPDQTERNVSLLNSEKERIQFQGLS